MAGESVYKEFDTITEVSTSTFQDTVSIGKYAFRKREFVLGVVAILALLGVLALAVVLAVRASDTDSSSSSSSPSAASSSKVTGDVSVDYCTTMECLRAALYQKPLIEPKADPCDDFYGYACGNYAIHHQQTPLMPDVTAIMEITNVNRQRLSHLTVYPRTKDDHRKKFTDFLDSCNNHFDKMELRGIPLIEQVIKPAGGWWVFDSQVLSNFTLQSGLETVHIDYWTDALFNTFIRTNINSWNNKIVEIDFSGIGMSYFFYKSETNVEPVQSYYKRYMKILATLLTFDNQMSPNSGKIDQFADDAFEVEQTIAQIYMKSAKFRNPHHPDNLMTLAQLNGHMNGSFDFIHYMKTLFDKHPDKFDGDTQISVTLLGYFEQLGLALQKYESSGDDGKRKLHNYLMWRLITNFAGELSWEYVHASRKLIEVLYGYKDVSSGFTKCFEKAVGSLSEILNELFSLEFIKDGGNKEEAEKIIEDIKEVLLSGIDKLPWMGKANREYAMKKIRNSLYKVGFPEELTDYNYMQNKYKSLTIDKEDYFGNVLRLNKRQRDDYNRVMGNQDSRTEWAYHIFDPVVDYYNPWHELIVTSAFLQNPLFNGNGPSYYNYGGVGSILATNLIHAIDEYGANYKEDGSHFGDWWSETTRSHYADIRKCAVDSQKDSTVGPFKNQLGMAIPVNSTKVAQVWAPQLLADASGIRISYLAYKNKEKKDGREKLPPGFSKFSADQMFFLSFAQSYCQNTPDATKLNQLVNGKLPSKNRVNSAMKAVPEFQKAFKCPAKPNQPKPCLLFNL